MCDAEITFRDATLDRLYADVLAREQPPFVVTPGAEGAVFRLG